MIWLVIVLASVGSGWMFGHGDAVVNFHAAGESAVADGLGALLGAALGLFSRDRIRRHLTFASPTRAYTGKLLLFAAVSGASTFVMSPVGWPSSVFHACIALIATGLWMWIGNLPVRL